MGRGGCRKPSYHWLDTPTRTVAVQFSRLFVTVRLAEVGLGGESSSDVLAGANPNLAFCRRMCLIQKAAGSYLRSCAIYLLLL